VFSIEPLWLGELLRGVIAAAVFGVGFLAARWRWKRGERDDRGFDSGMD
jgi:hypothetical protein